MTYNKKAAPAIIGQEAAQAPSAAASVPQVQPKNQAESNKQRRHILGIHSKVYSVAIKCYDEQLQAGEAQNRDGLAALIKSVDKSRYQILAIMHDRDTVTDGIWAEAAVKPHYHIILRCASRKSRIKVSTVLNMLGICFRQDLDDGLWKARGVETTGNFARYANYLTHETADAIKSAKERYDVSEIMSNLTLDEIEQVRGGYVQVSENRKPTQDEFITLDKEAYDLGKALKNFDEWYDKLPFSVRSNSKMNTIRESYNRGVDARLSEDKHVTRLCVYIQGAPNSGKTYAVGEALKSKKMLNVSGGGSGKFDDLRPDHEAIIIDDDTCPNLLNMTDNYMCRVYRRQSGNPLWAGKYFIVTSNLPFEEWVRQCGIDVWDTGAQSHSAHYEAILSRFFVCEIRDTGGTQHLVFTSGSLRGNGDVQKERLKMFDEFIKEFNRVIGEYQNIRINGSAMDLNAHPLSAFMDDFEEINRIGMEYIKEHGDYLEDYPEGYSDFIKEYLKDNPANYTNDCPPWSQPETELPH